MLNRLKCIFKGHDYNISTYLTNFIEQPCPNGMLNNERYQYLCNLRPLVHCNRCKRIVKWKP